MKKISFIIFFSILIALFLASTVSAITIGTNATVTKPVIVSGRIYFPEIGFENGVDGAEVTVVCDGVTRHDTTNIYGGYSTDFKGTDCGAGDTAFVTATKEGLGTGSASGIVKDFTYIEFAIIDVVIPEFGTITAGLALAGAAVGYLRMRKRNLKRT